VGWCRLRQRHLQLRRRKSAGLSIRPYEARRRCAPTIRGSSARGPEQAQRESGADVVKRSCVRSARDRVASLDAVFTVM
jgi:hypothetical protein